MFKYYTATFDIDYNKSPYNRGNHPVFIFASKCFAYENVGTRRAESGALPDGDGLGAGSVLTAFTHGTPCPYNPGNLRTQT